MESKRPLPIGIQDFATLRSDNCLYVDKTHYIAKLTEARRPYFLSRPRRFGKSLFLSTLRYYFEGRRELFKGLAIEQTEEKWTVHPVLYFSLLTGVFSSADSLEHLLCGKLEECEKQWGGAPNETDIALRFSKLIQSAYAKSNGAGVVVLIDEYDKPLLEAPSEEIQTEMREKVLRPFYAVLKDTTQYLRLVFITGVTTFAKVSMSSNLNHLVDISLHEKYAGICGFSEAEILNTFKTEIKALADERKLSVEATLAVLNEKYGGYHFSRDLSQGVYSPTSLLLAFGELRFGPYWFETNMPIFLMKMVKQAQLNIREIDTMQLYLTTSALYDPRCYNPDPLPLMYQTGCLTITAYDERLDSYLLGFPNEDVRLGFFKSLLFSYLSKSKPRLSTRKKSY